ncbi:MAG: ribosomal protein S18-alanine N-acetyltransferase [Clostridiales bacterium]|nr:ribosomal protein S18-alanine N-acetyltransferase [Clostridiales bacterium]
MITVRKAEKADGERIAELENAYIDCPWSKDQIVSEIESENACFLVADDGGEVIGYLSGEITVDECEISNIAVAEWFRRRGVGTRLFEKFIECVRERKVTTVFLLVRDDNTPAIGLYKAMGFEEVGRRRKYYVKDKDALIMRLNF